MKPLDRIIVDADDEAILELEAIGSSTLLPDEELERVIALALSKTAEDDDLCDRDDLLTYVAERLCQDTAVLGTFRTNAAGLHERYRRRVDFWTGVLGRLVVVSRGGLAASYSHFKTGDDNQVDIYLRRIGYFSQKEELW